MSAIVRKTYDTDSIVLRRIFVVDPVTNTRVSTNSVLVTGTNGSAAFQDGSVYLSTIGAPTSLILASTITGLGTLGYLSAGTAGDVTSGQLISTVGGLGNIYLSSGSGDVTVANLTSTTNGLGTLSYLSSSQLISTVAGLGNIYLSTGGSGTGDVTVANLTSTANGLGTLGYLSSSQLISTVAGLGNIYLSTGGGSGDVSKANLTSTTLGLGTLGYLSTALTKLIAGTNITISPTNGEGIVTINASGGSGGGTGDVTSTNLTSTTLGLGTLGYLSSSQLLSTVTGLGNLYVSTGLTTINLMSTTQGLGSLGYISTSQLVSTVASLLNTFSTVYNISSAGGVNISATTSGFFLDLTNANISTLINNNITINTSGGNVNDVDLTSTTRGLGTFGYISSLTLRQTLQSTVTGLGTSGYLSTALTKLIAGTNITISPTNGEGIVTINSIGGSGSGDVTSTNLTSTTLGLGTLGYLSSSQLISTVRGLGSVGFLSTAVTKLIAGTNITISPVNGEGIVTINSIGGSGGGSGDVTSTNLTSTTLGLGTLGYISAATLGFSLASTTANLGRIGYVSSSALTSTVLGLSRFYVSTASLQTNLSSFSTGLTNNFFTRTLIASTITADLLNISTISFGTGSGFITIPSIRANYISSFSSQTDVAYVSKSISGAQLQFSSIEGNGSLLTNLVTGVPSSLEGLGSFGYLSSASNLISSPFLETVFQSTIEGLGTAGYISTGPSVRFEQLLTDDILTSTLTLLNYRTPPPPIEGGFLGGGSFEGFAFTLFVSSGNFYIGDAGVIDSDGLPTQSNQIITDTLLISSIEGLGTAGYISSATFTTVSSLTANSGVLNFSSLFVNNTPIIFDSNGNLVLSFQTI